jgi:hypothetical protein
MGIAGVPGPCGLTVVGNTADLHFRLQLAGDRTAISKGTGSFVVDDLEVHVSTVSGRDISPDASAQSGIELLRTHARWESARLSEALGREVTPEEIAILTSEKMPSALVWRASGAGRANVAVSDEASDAMAVPATWPSESADIVYMTAAFGQRVLAMSAQGLPGKVGVDMVAKAELWMASLVVSPDAISVAQVSDDMRAAITAGCRSPAAAPAATIELPKRTSSHP